MAGSVRPPFFSGDFGHDTHPGRGEGSLPPIKVNAPARVGVLGALAIGFVMGARRLVRRPMALAGLLGLALVVAGGYIERRTSSAGAVDRSLRGSFALVIPLVAFAAVVQMTGRKRLAHATWPAARFGVARRDVALGLVLATAVVTALLSACYAALAILAAQTGGLVAVLPDVVVSGRIAVFTAAAYVAWFALGATFFERGRGAWLPLVVDFLLGGTTGIFGAVFPRGNAKNLLGDAAPLGLVQSSSSAILVGSALVLAILAALRCRD